MDRVSHYRRVGDATGSSEATAPARLIGHTEDGRRVYQRADGYEPVTNCNLPAEVEHDADGNWVETGLR